jgi:hypothetical protein
VSGFFCKCYFCQKQARLLQPNTGRKFQKNRAKKDLHTTSKTSGSHSVFYAMRINRAREARLIMPAQPEKER